MAPLYTILISTDVWIHYRDTYADRSATQPVLQQSICTQTRSARRADSYASRSSMAAIIASSSSLLSASSSNSHMQVQLSQSPEMMCY